MDWNWLEGTELSYLPAFATSLAIGLLIGLERERHAGGTKAGLRTFALVGVFGALSAFLSEQTGSSDALVAGMLIVAAMIIIAYARDPAQKEPWTTTVVAILVCYGLAAMVWFDHAIAAVSLAIVTTALLYFKAELRGITTRLERRDLISILQFGVLMFVVLPILPDRDYGPYGAINPHQIWFIVVLISGVNLAGYVAFRLIGQRYGAPLLGIFGGLVSSTATTLVYARHGKGRPELASTASVVILLANLVLLIRLAVLIAFMAPRLLATLLPPLGCGLLFGVISLAWLARSKSLAGDGPVFEIKNPTELRTALAFGAIYAIVLLLAAWFSDIAGTAGLYGVSLIAGLTDVDAITLSNLHLFNTGHLSGGQVAIAVVLAITANTIFKLGLVLVVGGRALFRRCAGTMAAVAGGLAIVLLVTK